MNSWAYVLRDMLPFLVGIIVGAAADAAFTVRRGFRHPLVYEDDDQ